MMIWRIFSVWKRNWIRGYGRTAWSRTSWQIKARTREEAERKLQRRYYRAGFSYMDMEVREVPS